MHTAQDRVKQQFEVQYNAVFLPSISSVPSLRTSFAIDVIWSVKPPHHADAILGDLNIRNTSSRYRHNYRIRTNLYFLLCQLGLCYANADLICTPIILLALCVSVKDPPNNQDGTTCLRQCSVVIHCRRVP